MSVAIVTGSCGLIGAETTRRLLDEGLTVVGIDNDLRSYFFGEGASTSWVRRDLEKSGSYRHEDGDIRDEGFIDGLFKRYGKEITTVIHTAAQPSHDWAAREPLTDFSVNATGTLVLLEATRCNCPEASFLYVSTNKVYGDRPNHLPLVEGETRYEIAVDHEYRAHGVPETMSVDQTTHSLFGVSKLSADLAVQEYGRYFGMRTACFRGGCLTGSGHSGAELHGFLAYLMQCTMNGTPYTVFGYKGKQVRDNIHSSDLVGAFWRFIQEPRSAVVYNIGGGRAANCSMLEAIAACQEVSGRELNWTYSEKNRIGDHMWWISDTRAFEFDYPEWSLKFDMLAIYDEIHAGLAERTKARTPT